MPDATPSAHDAAMIAKVDEVAAKVNQSLPTALGQAPEGTPPAVAPAAAQRPDNVPEKFWDAATGQVNTEALLKSYTELEKGKPPEVQPPATTPDPATDAVKAAKLDMTVLSQEFAEKGTLSDDSYKALEAAGFPKTTVDQYIAGQAALAEKRDAQALALAGGQEQFTAMASWATTGLPAAEIEQFNQVLQSGNDVQVKQAVLALKAQYEASVGKDPTLIKGNAAASSTGEQPFQSRAEVTAAMRDPRYKADPAYRALVERRIGLMEVF